MKHYRFKAYQLFKDGKRLDTTLTVNAMGRLLPEDLVEFTQYSKPIATWPLDKQLDFKLFELDTKKGLQTWVKHLGADRVVKVIYERKM